MAVPDTKPPNSSSKMSDPAFKGKTRLILIAILIAASILNMLVYFQKIVLFLNTNLETLWGLLLVLVLLGFFLGYRLSQPNGGSKPYFFDYGEVAWLIRPSSLRAVWVEDTPYCRKCKVQYMVLQNGALVCPLCQNTKDVLPLPAMHKAVENIAKTKTEGLDKLKVR
jgi:hypothetical protein